MFRYEIMHSCWSPVPKCRPSFQQLVAQLEGLWTKLSSAATKEPLLYVNLEDGDREPDSGLGASADALGTHELQWGVPWQCVDMEEDEKDWLVMSSGAALAIGGDYRYIIGPCGSTDKESRQSEDGPSEDIKDDEVDIIINV